MQLQALERGEGTGGTVACRHNLGIWKNPTRFKFKWRTSRTILVLEDHLI